MNVMFTMSSPHPVSMDVSGAVQSRVAVLNRRLVVKRKRFKQEPNREHASSSDSCTSWYSGARCASTAPLTRPRRQLSMTPWGYRTYSASRARRKARLDGGNGGTNDRINTLEQLQRMSAQTTNHFDNSLRGLNARMADVCTDITVFR